MKKKVRKGIPNGLRGVVWCTLTQINNIKKEYNETYSVTSPKVQKIIRLDFKR